MGERFIQIAGLHRAGLVIIGKDHRSRIVRQCPSDNLAWIDMGACQRALKHFFAGDQATLNVKKQTQESLGSQSLQPQPEKPGDGLR